MKKYFTALLALLLMAGGFASSGHTEQKPRAVPQIKILEGATVEKLTKAEEIAEQHRMLSTLSGTWHYNLQYWTDEKAEAQTSSGLIGLPPIKESSQNGDSAIHGPFTEGTYGQEAAIAGGDHRAFAPGRAYAAADKKSYQTSLLTKASKNEGIAANLEPV